MLEQIPHLSFFFCDEERKSRRIPVGLRSLLREIADLDLKTDIGMFAKHIGSLCISFRFMLRILVAVSDNCGKIMIMKLVRNLCVTNRNVKVYEDNSTIIRRKDMQIQI